MQSKALGAMGWGGALSLIGLLVGAMFQNYYGTFINCLEWWFVAGVFMTASRLNVFTSEKAATASRQIS